MVATALKEIFFPLVILVFIMIVLDIWVCRMLLRKKDLDSIMQTIFGSLISGLIIALILGLAKMDWNIIWDLFN